MQAPTILLLSAYGTDSHRAWADALVRGHPEVHWQRRELPGRHFRWRIRGNPLSWLDTLPERPPDRILATSMVDLATLKGLQPRLAAVPTIYYFHENQFAYPVSAGQARSLEPQLIQLYGALAADRIVFNSAFNRESFLDGAAGLLKRTPDAVPACVIERLRARSAICPVPIDPIPAGDIDERLIVWNHRWEYDKEPALFARAMVALARRGAGFRLALLGPRGARGCSALDELRAALPGRIVADAKAAPSQYREILGRAGIAVSTARHEFQGLAMLEAASAGARPLVPDALSYPEQYPPSYRYPPGDADALVERLAAWLDGGLPPPVDVTPWHAAALGEDWGALLHHGEPARVD